MSWLGGDKRSPPPMAEAWISGGIFRPVVACSKFRRPYAGESRGGIKVSYSRRRQIGRGICAVNSDIGDQILPQQDQLKRVEKSGDVDVEGLIRFLYDDLPHLFDEQGIDRSRYDDRVQFRDPITSHDTVDGYLFNITFLKLIFRPDFQLHYVKQTGPLELTTRWTMRMKVLPLPWKPELVFTGVSIMSINPQTQKFCGHIDIWDSIQNNDYFSLEGFLDFVKQLQYYKTPDLQTPKYQILKRMGNYEIRKYEPFLVVESKSDRLSGTRGFNDVTGYIFGKNAASEKIPMTTPVFTQATDSNLSDVSIQIMLPLDKEMDKLPEPSTGSIGIRRVNQGIAAVSKFSGKATEEMVQAKEKELRAALTRDGLNPQNGCLFARYNDPGRTRSFIMRNEVLIQLDGFTLD